MIKYTNEIIEFMIKNALGNNNETLTSLINDKFETNFTIRAIKSARYRFKANSGIDARFKKGNVSFNKGKKGMPQHPNSIKTQFKKGQKPHNTVPIGTILEKDEGYLYQKIAETKPARHGWRALHLITYEQHFGPVPDNHVVIFIDGDRKNVNISNLALISRAELAFLNRKRLLFPGDVDGNKALIYVAKIESKISGKEENI